MARPKSDTPAYCHHKRSGRGYVTIDGRQRWLPGPYDSAESRAGYDRLIAQWLAAGRSLPADAGAAGPTVAMVALRFWNHAQQAYRKPDGTPTREAENFRPVIRMLRLHYGDTPADAFGGKALQDLRSIMLKPRQETDPATGETVTVPGWSRTYTNRQVKRVKLIFAWAATQEVIVGTKLASLRELRALPRGREGARETEKVQPVADELVDATLPFLAPPFRAIVQLERLSGARGGELIGLRTCDVDLSGDVWKVRPAQHKTAHHGAERVIRFGPKAQDVLRPFLRADVATPIFRPADVVAWSTARKRERRGTPVQPSQQARAERVKPRKIRATFTANDYAHAVARACVQAFPLPAELARAKVPTVKANGRKGKRWETRDEWRARLGPDGWAKARAWRKAHHWHPHQLRHAAATAFRAAQDVDAARIILGHASGAITEQYAAADQQKADALVRAIG